MIAPCYRIDPVTGNKTTCEVEHHLCPRCGKPIPRPDFPQSDRNRMMCAKCPSQQRKEKKKAMKDRIRERMKEEPLDVIKLTKVLIKHQKSGLIRALDVIAAANIGAPPIVRFEYNGRERHPSASQLHRLQAGAQLSDIWSRQ